MRQLHAQLLVPFLAALGLLLVACGPEYPNCDNDEGCHEGEFCVNGQCQDCRTNEDCPAGQQCSSGACEAIPGYCDDASPCPSGQECVANRCQAVREVQCDDARPCPTGQECVGGNCSGISGYCDTSTPCPSGQRCDTNNRCVAMCSYESVYFAFDSHAISTESRTTLQTDLTCTRERNPGSLTLTGHADSRGTEEYNLALSENRARAVQRYLQSLGFRSPMQIVGRGEEMASGYDEAGYQRDRRVDIE